jgi:hypothetical protein
VSEIIHQIISIMKILLVSPHFNGHYLAIEKLADIINKHFPFISIMTIKFDNQNNKTTDPMEFVLNRAKDDIDVLEKMDLSDVCLIIYDFFAIAGKIVGQRKKIPTICSIPAIMSDKFKTKDEYFLNCFHKRSHLINELGLEIPDLLSDGFLFASKDNIVWNYQSMYDIIPSKPNSNFYFVGSKSQFDNHEIKTKKNIVYFSLGTVVPNSLYNCNPQLQEYILSIYNYIIDHFGKNLPTYQLIVSCPLNLKSNYPNVIIENYLNQLSVLSEASLFITHGGGNSLNEAIMLGTPMIVIPFFGDQYVSAKYVQNKQFGECIYPIDSEGKQDFGNSTVTLINKLDDLNKYNKTIPVCINFMLNNLSAYANNINLAKTYDEKNVNLNRILECINKNLSFDSMWQDYDLLFGTTPDRKEFVKCHNVESKFKIGMTNDQNRYLTVDKLGIQTPVLIDQWNDLLRENSVGEIENNPNLNQKVKTAALNYRDHLTQKGIKSDGKTGKLIIPDDSKEIINVCCHGIDFFLKKYDCTIHFVIDKFDQNVNVGTNQELQHILKKYDVNFKIIFWFKVNDEYQMVPIDKMKTNINLDSDIEKLLHLANKEFNDLQKLIKTHTSKYNIWLQNRIKTKDSIHHKLKSNLLELNDLNDVIGFRIIYPWTATLHEIANELESIKELNIFKKVITENNKVIYLFGRFNDIVYEIQFWPSLIYHCFEHEHDNVYKGTSMTKETIQKSLDLRKAEHELQDIIDNNKLF